jgi:hypothetical protein
MVGVEVWRRDKVGVDAGWRVDRRGWLDEEMWELRLDGERLVRNEDGGRMLRVEAEWRENVGFEAGWRKIGGNWGWIMGEWMEFMMEGGRQENGGSWGMVEKDWWELRMERGWWENGRSLGWMQKDWREFRMEGEWWDLRLDGGRMVGVEAGWS